MAEANIITQVSAESGYRQPLDNSDDTFDLSSSIHLNIRGEQFTITRDELMNLPESILLCLFPNGVFLDINGNPIQNLTERDVVYVNFDPECFKYIIDSFAKAAEKLPRNAKREVYDAYQTPEADLLSQKPSIIVLREDLDYYVIPPRKGISPQGVKAIKATAGSYLVNHKNVFDGLGYKPGKTLGPAEEHLLEMLCSSGFDINTEWGHRSSEPGKTVLTSLALIDLKTPEPPSEPDSPALNPITSNSNKRKSRLAELATSAARSASRSVSRTRKEKNAGTSSKLLLFWRKPARKCWWSNEIVQLTVPEVLNDNGSIEQITVHLHIRRVWTLELSVIGVN